MSAQLSTTPANTEMTSKSDPKYRFGDSPSHKRREVGLRPGARGKCGMDYAGSDCVLYVQPAAPSPGRGPGLAKDGGKNLNMTDGKEKNVMPVSTA